MIRLLLTILLFFNTFNLSASEITDKCIPNLIKEDMCVLADRIATEGRKVLPIKVSDSMSVVSINSIYNKLIVLAYMNYNRDHLRSLYSGDVSIEEKIKVYLKNYSESNTCINNQTKAFINLGGEIEYRYAFSDGNIFDIYTITSCK